VWPKLGRPLLQRVPKSYNWHFVGQNLRRASNSLFGVPKPVSLVPNFDDDNGGAEKSTAARPTTEKRESSAGGRSTRSLGTALKTYSRHFSRRVLRPIAKNVRADLLWSAVISVDSNQTIRIILSFFQVLGGIARTFSSIYPPILYSVISVYTAISAEVFYNIDFGCIAQSNHYLSLVLNIVAPLVAIFVVFAIHVVLEWRIVRAGGNEHDVYHLRASSYGLFLFILFLVYPGVSSTVLITFSCTSFDDGSTVLTVDYTVDCNAPNRASWLAVAGFGVVIYVIGIPLIYSYSLWRVRHFINPPDGSPPDQEKFASVLLLTEIYKQKFYWFEVFELLRKLVQNSLLIFFLNGSVLQVGLFFFTQTTHIANSSLLVCELINT